MVEKLDEAVGKLLTALDEVGLAETTLVVFSSDNGGIAGVHSQKPLRAGKGSYYEGGIREPLVMRWPGTIKPGTTCDEAVNTLDFYPTFLDVADLNPPEVQLDGVSLLPLMTQSGDWKPIPQFWHFPIYLQAYDGRTDDARDPLFRTRPGSAIRSGQWKLHECFEDDTLELYDLSNDPGERSNLASEMPDKARELHRMLTAWRKQVNAPVPSQLNPTYSATAEQKQIEKVLGK